MGNILVKKIDIFFGTPYIFTSLLNKKNISVRMIDTAYIVVLQKQDHLVRKTNAEYNLVAEFAYLDNETNNFLIEQYINNNISLLNSNHCMQLSNTLILMYLDERERVWRCLNTLIDEYLCLEIEDVHFAILERKNTKNDVTSYIDIKSTTQKALSLFSGINKHSKLKNSINCLKKLLNEKNLYLSSVKFNQPHVVEFVYFCIQVIYYYIDALDYGINFYSTYPYLIYTDVAPKIRYWLVLQNQRFKDMKFKKNICIKVNSILPIHIKTTFQIPENEEKYICFVRINKGKTPKTKVMFSHGAI